MSYKMELPAEFADFHDIFHVSQLQRCLQVLDLPEVLKNIDHRTLDLNTYLTYHEVLLLILDEAIHLTRWRKIMFSKVQWSNHSDEESTWEREDHLKEEFHSHFNA
jgi:hypothetical protein